MRTASAPERSSKAAAPASPAPSSFWTERRIGYAVLVVCLVALVVLRFGFMRHNGVTVDEFIHLQAGYRYLQCGEFGNNPEHPPLVKLVAALPIRGWQITGFPPFSCGERAITGDETSNIAYLLSQGPHYAELLWKARLALLVFPVLLLAAVFFATRRWFGGNAAIIAALLFTFEPTLVAHGALVTTDAALATFAFAAVWLSIEFVDQATWARFLGVSFALGLALASKHSAVILPLILLVTMLLARQFSDRARAISIARLLFAWAGICSIAVVVLWSCYGFRYAALPHEVKPAYDFAELFRQYGMSGSFVSGQVVSLAHYRILPEAYLAGLTDIATKSSRQAYLFGRIYPAGVWYYFPVALAIKTTLGVIILFAISMATTRFWTQHKRVVIPLFAAFLIFLAVSMTSGINIGVRHVLPVYPFLIVFAAFGASVLMQKRSWSRLIGIILVAGSVVSGIHAAPAQLSYANEIFGGSSHLYRFLGDSNLDWGQSRIYLDSYLSSRFAEGTADCAVAQGKFWNKPPRCLQLPAFCTGCAYSELDPVLPDHFEGTLILQPYAIMNTSAYLPFLNRKPDEVAGDGTILVYRGKFDLRELAALRRYHRGLYLLYVMGDPLAAEREFAAAEPYCPESNRVDLELKHTTALTALERWDEALYHAHQVLRLTENDPAHRRERQIVLDALQAKP